MLTMKVLFTENAYYWNSKGEKGNAVDFLMSYHKMDFTTAIKELAGQQKKEMAVQPHAVQPFSLCFYPYFYPNLLNMIIPLDLYYNLKIIRCQ